MNNDRRLLISYDDALLVFRPFLVPKTYNLYTNELLTQLLSLLFYIDYETALRDLSDAWPAEQPESHWQG